jgi:hypothetical protein
MQKVFLHRNKTFCINFSCHGKNQAVWYETIFVGSVQKMCKKWPPFINARKCGHTRHSFLYRYSFCLLTPSNPSWNLYGTLAISFNLTCIINLLNWNSTSNTNFQRKGNDKLYPSGGTEKPGSWVIWPLKVSLNRSQCGSCSAGT